MLQGDDGCGPGHGWIQGDERRDEHGDGKAPSRSQADLKVGTTRVCVAPPSGVPVNTYLTPSNSTSNTSVAFGGITPPAPRLP